MLCVMLENIFPKKKAFLKQKERPTKIESTETKHLYFFLKKIRIGTPVKGKLARI